MKLNTAPETIRTHGGACASRVSPEAQLRRSVMTCMLWENSFYEDGEAIASRISSLIKEVRPEAVQAIAVEAREQMKLRHIPLLLVREMARLPSHKGLVAETLERVIQRPDELCEFLAIYWKEGRCKVSAQVKKGLARAFIKFNEYSLAKYNQDGAIKLRDVLFICHAKPKDEAQASLWKRLIAGTLETPDTWEVSLSAGKDKKETWVRLMDENKLGALALLRNLRNMESAGVHKNRVFDALRIMKTERVLPFRFISAARAIPQWEDIIEPAMLRCLEQTSKLRGKTILVVDTSGSMHSGGTVSKKSDLSRVDAATALSILIREVCEEPIIYATAGDDGTMIHATARVPARRGFALSDAIWGSTMSNKIGGGGIFLKQLMDFLFQQERDAERIIVLTDEQDRDHKCSPASANAFGKENYLINVSVEKNGINFGKWTSIHGWSEKIIDYIIENEKVKN